MAKPIQQRTYRGYQPNISHVNGMQGNLGSPLLVEAQGQTAISGSVCWDAGNDVVAWDGSNEEILWE